MHLAQAATLLAYSASCALLHSLLAQHYAVTCTSWLAALSLEPTPYCAFVRGSIRALQFAPLVAFAPRLLQHPAAAAV
jgi:hypothetical protein